MVEIMYLPKGGFTRTRVRIERVLDIELEGEYKKLIEGGPMRLLNIEGADGNEYSISSIHKDGMLEGTIFLRRPPLSEEEIRKLEEDGFKKIEL